MRITICGSLTFLDRMRKVAEELHNLGHDVLVPESVHLSQTKTFWENLEKEQPEQFWQIKRERMKIHCDKVAQTDAILALNYDKNDTQGYIGSNTFMEIGVAFYLEKKIYLAQSIPEGIFQEDLIAMKPVVIGGDWSLIQ